MKLGAFFLLEQPAPRTAAQVFSETIAQAQEAEALGFDEVWVGQHHFSEYGIAGSLPVVATALARETTRVRIGTGVSLLPFQHPVHLAEDWATVDQLSGGRLDLGVGRGYQPTEFAGFGVPMEEATERFQESLQVLRLAWTQPSFSFEGKHFQIPDLSVFPRPLQQPHPPLFVAALQPKSFEAAARLGLGVLAAPLITPLALIKSNLDLYRSVLRECGGDPDTMPYPLQQMVYVAPTDEQAREEAAPYFEWYYSTISRLVADDKATTTAPGYGFYRKSQEHLKRVTMDDLWESRAAAVGSPERVAAILGEMADHLGMNHLMAWMGVGGIPHARVLRSMNLLATEVMPRVRERQGIPT